MSKAYELAHTHSLAKRDAHRLDVPNPRRETSNPNAPSLTETDRPARNGEYSVPPPPR